MTVQLYPYLTKKSKMNIFNSMEKKKVIILIPIILLVLTGLFSCCSRKHTAEKFVDEKMLKEAIEYGKSKAGTTIYEFTQPWSVYLGYEVGKGRATYLSPFLQAAQLAKNAAEKNLEPDINIIRKVVMSKMDTLNFLVTTYGDEPDASRRLKAYLLYDNKKIEPVYSHFPPYGEFNRDYYQQINGEVRFPLTGIPRNAIVKLCIEFLPKEEKEKRQYHHHEGHEEETFITVGKVPPEHIITEFVFDLSKYK